VPASPRHPCKPLRYDSCCSCCQRADAEASRRSRKSRRSGSISRSSRPRNCGSCSGAFERVAITLPPEREQRGERAIEGKRDRIKRLRGLSRLAPLGKGKRPGECGQSLPGGARRQTRSPGERSLRVIPPGYRTARGSRARCLSLPLPPPAATTPVPTILSHNAATSQRPDTLARGCRFIAKCSGKHLAHFRPGLKQPSQALQRLGGRVAGAIAPARTVRAGLNVSSAPPRPIPGYAPASQGNSHLIALSNSVRCA
jgi:hypothetical protein